MSSLWKKLLASLTVFAVTLIVGTAEIAAGTPANTDDNTQSDHTEVMPGAQAANSDHKIPGVAELSSQANKGIDSNNAIASMTSVSQLSDVQTLDWAFQALQSLVERYGCIAGYPNSTYRGNRALTRYEFAAGLNACLNRVNELISTGTSDLVRKQDLKTLQRLQVEFTPQLAILRGRVDALEASTTEVEAHQFSTTTKLSGDAVFAVVGVATGQNADGQKIDRVTAFGDRVRINLDTSFTGRDLLRTRLQVLNLNALSGTSTLTPEGDLGFAGETFGTDNNNSVGLNELLYSFPLTRKTRVFLAGNAAEPEDFINTVNPYIGDEGSTGALSNFGLHNPIYNLLSGAGIVVTQQFNKNLELTLGYLATTPSVANPTRGNGLVNGPYGAVGQLLIKPSNKFNLGLTYVNSYNDDLTAGSRRANLRSYLASISAPVTASPPGSSEGNSQPAAALAAFGGTNLPVSSNSYGVEASLQINPKVIINGWVGYTASRTLSTVGGTINRGDLSIWNWAAALAFPDLGKEGNLAGIIVGMEPKVTGVTRALRDRIGTDPSTSLHVEGFYQYQLNDNIAITPGIVWLTAPDHNNANADTVIGVLRLTFTFGAEN